LSNGRFKPGMFFVSTIILLAKHGLTSKAASKSVLLRLLQVGPAIIAKELKLKGLPFELGIGPIVHGRLQNLNTSEDTFGHDITPLRSMTRILRCEKKVP